MTALYIHWPFCRKKCPYCDFNSHVRSSVDEIAFTQALLSEMRWMAEHAGVHDIHSIFFGGGTPSLMPPATVAALIDETAHLWPVSPSCEITLEANPTSSEATRFVAYREAGVNRLSLGVQSLHDTELQFLGREHSANEARNVLEMVQKHFARYSFDLIYARPHQTAAMWEAELHDAMQYARGHISLYQLTVEPDTPFARLYRAGGFILPSDDIAADLYDVTRSLCEAHNLYSYEISNYAASGQESRHNLAYWQGEDYIGIGAGAHGRIYNMQGQWEATAAIKSPERWLDAVQRQGHGLEICDPVPDDIRMEEYLLGGLRLKGGVSYQKIHAHINQQQCSLMQEMGLLTLNADALSITQQGRLVTERIIQCLLS